jgi:drug/metabolite transporter (DMT)-like permease
MLTPLHRHRFTLALIGAAACWGLATVVAKSALEEIPAVALLPTQLAASTILVTPFLLARYRREPRTQKVGRLAALGVLNPGISYALGLVGLTYITASESVLLWATEPIMIMALAAVMLREQINRTQVLAAGAATIGVVLVVIAPDRSNQPVGIALTLAAVAACAFYTIYSRRWAIDESSGRVVSLQHMAALVFAIAVLAVSLLITDSPVLSNISIRSWASAALSGCLYYGIAFWLYLMGLQHTPASVAGQYINLIPIFGIGASSLLLNEQLTSRQWLGALVIVVAVTVAARSITSMDVRSTSRTYG